MKLAELDLPGALVLVAAIVAGATAYLGYVAITGEDGVLLVGFLAFLGGVTGTYPAVRAAMRDAMGPDEPGG